jgi:hypothetical protein
MMHGEQKVEITVERSAARTATSKQESFLIPRWNTEDLIDPYLRMFESGEITNLTIEMKLASEATLGDHGPGE